MTINIILANLSLFSISEYLSILFMPSRLICLISERMNACSLSFD